MDTARTVYAVEAPNPASDVAGETAAAFAASSMAFRSSDPGYSETLLRNAISVFQYADNYRGAYSDNADIRDGVCPFYCDFDGYQDELLWGAAWLRRASQDDSYLNYIENNGKTLGAEDNINEFGWDNKHAGLNVLVSKEFLEGNMYSLQSYKASADSFMCTLIPESSSSHIEYTPGGLIYKPGGSNLQHATSIAFLLLSYANYLARSGQSVNCGNISIGPSSSANKLRDKSITFWAIIQWACPIWLVIVITFLKGYITEAHPCLQSRTTLNSLLARKGQPISTHQILILTFWWALWWVALVMMIRMRMIEMIFENQSQQHTSMHHWWVHLRTLWPIQTQVRP
ncbi:Endoglucanase 24 [Vitis vinifera]|uniref:cellulase n=1 Tax=Vitis vinifera TaxID=29760 RepID=A0A438I909_VITVI|nr:Endoglucanase 24 [Vitis vinifera]